MVSLRTALAAILLVVVIDSARPSEGIAKTGTSTPQSKKEGASSTQNDLVLRLDVRRVPVDLVVTDKNGNPVQVVHPIPNSISLPLFDVRGLPEDEREVFDLVGIHGLTHAEADNSLLTATVRLSSTVKLPDDFGKMQPSKSWAQAKICGWHGRHVTMAGRGRGSSAPR